MDKFQEEILAGIPQDRLPEPKPYDKEINHAPKRKDPGRVLGWCRRHAG